MNPEALQKAALNVAQAHSPDRVLAQIVGDLSREPGVALARIWLMGEGDLCDRCAMRGECPDRTRCLHLAASAGRSRVDPDETWTRTNGARRRFPLGVRKIGRIGASGVPQLLHVHEDDAWLTEPAWARAEGIVCFGGQPLVFRGEVLGVLGLFSRIEVTEEQFGWLRTFADHAATALTNARLIAELEDLRAQVELERDYLRGEVREAKAFGRIIGESVAIRHVLEQVEAVAPTDATVLIEGESGTGKELIAAAVHEHSSRAGEAFVRVNCASIPHELFESEFFGHQKGAFTGATRDRAGRFQVADGGTLFLDEVGEIPLELQGKLLRALQEGQFSRVGEDVERSVDVRLVAATNRDLLREVQAGRFREDLYYRLTVFPIRVPPLRERREDIPLIARHFIEVLGGGQRSELREIDLEKLASHDWPGNVRELQNVIERARIRARGSGLAAVELPDREPAQPAPEPAARLLSDAELRELERRNLLGVLKRVRWKIAGAGGAAEFLGIHPATLASRLRAMGIERPR